MRNHAHFKKYIRFYVLNYNNQQTKSLQNYPNVRHYKVQLYPNQVNFISAQYKKLSNSNYQAWKMGREKCKNKRDKKGEGKLTWKKSVSIFLENKNNQFSQSNLFQKK